MELRILLHILIIIFPWIIKCHKNKVHKNYIMLLLMNSR